MIEICKWIKTDKGIRCEKCGYLYKGAAINPVRNCKSVTEGPVLKLAIDLPNSPQPQHEQPKPKPGCKKCGSKITPEQREQLKAKLAEKRALIAAKKTKPQS